jgi:hypothetical protein
MLVPQMPEQAADGRRGGRELVTPSTLYYSLNIDRGITDEADEYGGMGNAWLLGATWNRVYTKMLWRCQPRRMVWARSPQIQAS